MPLGMILDWTTLPMLILFPVRAAMFWRLAAREEAGMIEEFGDEYRGHMTRPRRQIPFVW